MLFFNPGAADHVSGGERSLATIIQNTARIQPTVLVTADSAFGRLCASWGLEVLTWPLPSSLFRHFWRRSPVALWTAVSEIRAFSRRLRRWLVSENVSVVHCNGLHAIVLAGLRAPPGVKLVFNIRNRPRVDWKWQWALLRADRIITLSSELRQQVVEQVWPPFRRRVAAKTEAIYSAVDFSSVDRAEQSADRTVLRERLGVGRGGCAIGYIGAICPRKAQLEFIENVVGPVCASVPDAHFYFIGSPDYGDVEYSDRCRRRVDELGLTERVRFRPFQENIGEWYQALDFTALASRREGLARVMIESLAHGRPVVSFTVTSAREILEEHRCGFAVESGDYTGFADRTTQMCRDERLRAELGARGRRIARQLFDPTPVAAAYEQVYAELGESARRTEKQRQRDSA